MERACDGGRTLTATRGGTDFAECVACGTAVRWDLVDHPFWGFQTTCGHPGRGLRGDPVDRTGQIDRPRDQNSSSSSFSSLGISNPRLVSST